MKDNEILKKLGIKIGHYTNFDSLTGATCFIPDGGADIGIDIRGSNTGSINISAYEPKGTEKIIDAIVLTGGSTFGLECAIGVMDYLKSPAVTGAVIYDRCIGKDDRPHLKDGFEMANNASYTELSQGNVGVGTGATCGKWNKGNIIKGGFGYSFKKLEKNVYIGAFVVTNSCGDIINPNTDKFYCDSGNFDSNNYLTSFRTDTNLLKGTNTTLAVIVTNIAMERTELMKVSELAHDGMARAIFPVHTNYDGDIIFSISPYSKNRIKLSGSRTDIINYVGINASDVMVGAIKNSILHAESVLDIPCYKDIKKG